ncbi:hypothetical protein ACFOJF_08215 [Pseudocitrobacter faecalis]
MLNVENVLIDVAQLLGNNRSVNISGMAQFNDYSTKIPFDLDASYGNGKRKKFYLCNLKPYDIWPLTPVSSANSAICKVPL